MSKDEKTYIQRWGLFKYVSSQNIDLPDLFSSFIPATFIFLSLLYFYKE